MAKADIDNACIAGIFFTSYEACKPLYGSLLPSSTPQPAIHALASGTAELASCAVLTPAEVIKQNAQMLRRDDRRLGSRSTSMEALRMLWRHERGPMRRLWTGYTALAARNLPFTAMQFPMFEFVRGKIWDWRDRQRAVPQSGGQGSSDTATSGERLQIQLQDRNTAALGVTSTMVETGLVTGTSAAVSGSLAAVLTTPTDVVKTRMMLSAGEDNGNGARSHGLGNDQGHRPDQHRQRQRQRQDKLSGLGVARRVVRERGIRGLFRGGLLRAGWTALGSGLYLGTYEVAKVWLKNGKGGAISTICENRRSTISCE